MKVNAVNFGNHQRVPVNHEEMQNKAFVEIMKHYQETGKYEPARIDYFQNGEIRITYLSENKKSTNLIKKIITTISKLFRKK